MNEASVTSAQLDKLRGRLRNLKCPKHPAESISKICKHSLCKDHHPLCNICIQEHDIVHFSFFEDAESLVSPNSIKQIRDIAAEMKRRLSSETQETPHTRTLESVFDQFERSLEENKAKLVDCLINNVILKHNEDLKAQLKSLTDKIERKYQLILETRGEDSKTIREFLNTYVRACSFVSELSEAMRNRSGKHSVYPQVQHFMQEVEDIFHNVRNVAKLRLEEFFTSKSQKLEVMSKGSSCREVKDEPTQGQSRDSDCEIIMTTPATRKKNSRSNYNKHSPTTQECDPPLTKKVKYNRLQAPLVHQDSPVIGSNVFDSKNEASDPNKHEMSIEDSNARSRGLPVSQIPIGEDLDDEKSNDLYLMEGKDENCFEKMRRDFQECTYERPVRELLVSLFKLKTHRKYISKIINTKILSIRRMAKRDLRRAFEIFVEISELIAKEDDPMAEAQIKKLSHDFYQILPFYHDVVLDDVTKLKEKINVLESLNALRVLLNVITTQKEDENYLIDRYKKMRCKIELLGKRSSEYKTVEQYFSSTSLNDDGEKKYTINLQHIFKVAREGEDTRYLKDFENKLLLWCSYRFTDTVKILKEGFEFIDILPSQLYQFGKVVHFFDMVGGSCAANCRTSIESDQAFIFLCEVAVGRVQQLRNNQTQNSNSNAEGQDGFIVLADGVKIPLKKPAAGSKKPKCNRYIISNPNQIKVKYLLQVQFSYK